MLSNRLGNMAHTPDFDDLVMQCVTTSCMAAFTDSLGTVCVYPHCAILRDSLQCGHNVCFMHCTDSNGGKCITWMQELQVLITLHHHAYSRQLGTLLEAAGRDADSETPSARL